MRDVVTKYLRLSLAGCKPYKRLVRCINMYRPEQTGRPFGNDIVKPIFMNPHHYVLIKISQKFVPGCPVENKPALVQVMAWRQPDDEPLLEPILMADWSIYIYICVVRPRFENIYLYCISLNIYIYLYLYVAIDLSLRCIHLELELEIDWKLRVVYFANFYSFSLGKYCFMSLIVTRLHFKKLLNMSILLSFLPVNSPYYLHGRQYPQYCLPILLSAV